MTSYIMAIDQGTTSTRAILFDKASNIVGSSAKGAGKLLSASGLGGTKRKRYMGKYHVV